MRVSKAYTPPALHPWEASARSSQIAVDMCVMNVQYMNTLSQFLSPGELFHVQLQLLYGLVDVMAATKEQRPETIADLVKKHFEALRRERLSYPCDE